MKKTLLLLVLLGGPVLAKDPHIEVPVPIETPDNFRGADPALTGPSVGDLKWFEIFKDPQLKVLIDTAFKQNADLQTAMARVEVARANLGITSANQYPNLSVGGTQSTTMQSTHNPNFFPGFQKRTTSFGQFLVNLLSFELDIWGRLRNQTNASIAQLRASEEDRRAIMTVVVNDVATDYFNLLELDAELEIDNRTLATRTDSLNIIKAREEGGLGTLLDVRQGEQLVQQAALTVTDTQRQIEQMENNINLLMGQLPAPVVRGKSLIDQEQLPEVPAGLPSSLLQRRPDIRSAELNVEAQKFLIKSARASFFPQITLTGFFGFQSSALANMFTAGSLTGGATPSLAAPLFDGGRLRGNLHLVEGNQRLALINYVKVILTAFNDVSNALVQVSKIRQLRVQQEELVKILMDRSELAYMRYNGGVDTLLNALDADRDLFNAQLSTARARRDELVSIVVLYRSLGGGWQTDVPEAPAPKK